MKLWQLPYTIGRLPSMEVCPVCEIKWALDRQWHVHAIVGSMESRVYAHWLPPMHLV